MPAMNNSKFPIFLIPFLFVLTGCSLFSNMDGAMRLKNYSENKDHQEASVKRQNKNFDRLIAEVKGPGLGRYPDKKSIRKHFGPPVFVMQTEKVDTKYEVWLYRYSTQYFGTDKLYLYFDSKGILKDHDYAPSSKAPERKG